MYGKADSGILRVILQRILVVNEFEVLFLTFQGGTPGEGMGRLRRRQLQNFYILHVLFLLAVDL